MILNLERFYNWSYVAKSEFKNILERLRQTWCFEDLPLRILLNNKDENKSLPLEILLKDEDECLKMSLVYPLSPISLSGAAEIGHRIDRVRRRNTDPGEKLFNIFFFLFRLILFLFDCLCETLANFLPALSWIL